MRANGLKRLWEADCPAALCWLTIPSPISAEIMAHQGWDALVVDMQHGMIDLHTAAAMLIAISATEATPLVRVPGCDPTVIMRVLDAGAYGVICPTVGSAAEAETLVRACRYPPAGMRSYGPARALLYSGADYFEGANDTVLAIAMIETQDGLRNLDEILSVPGLDGIYVGPSDLSVSLGHPPSNDPPWPEVTETIADIAAVAAARGVVAGIHSSSGAHAARVFDIGYRFSGIQTDAQLLAAKARAEIADLRSHAQKRSRPLSN